MKKDFTYIDYTGDSVINRGFEIYDGWKDKSLSSRKIVAHVERAVSAVKLNKSKAASIDALSCLFALDMRIKEKYNNILRCLFSYFSWRRETRTLNTLKSELNIPLGETDIRNAIAVMIERLAEQLENEWDEDGDDEAHGGKRNGKAEDEAATEEKEIEEAAEENPEAEELADKEETKKDSEEKEEMPIEESPQEDAKEEIGEKKETAEQQLEAEITATDEKEELAQENHDNLKEENNVSDVESEMSTDKKEEAKAYNDAVDSPPIYEETVRDRSSEQTSFIDEMIIDNMVKGDKNIIGYQRIDEAERNKDANIHQDTVAIQNEKNKITDKDAYLYDKMIATNKGETQQLGKIESTKQAEKVSETKTEQPKESIQKNEKVSQIKTDQPKETIQNNDNINSTKQEIKPLSEMHQSGNLNADLDNNIAYALNANMSLESKMAIIRMKEEQLREHMNITLEELGMNDTSDVLRVSEPDAVSPPSAVQNRK